MTATAVLSDGLTQNVTNQVSWVSSDPSIASVTPDGLITTVAPGNATITASITPPNGSPATQVVTLTVRDAVVESLQLTPTNPSVAAGLSQQMTATAVLSDEKFRDVTNQVSWVSSDPSIASVTPDGLITTVAPGNATITASITTPDGSATQFVTLTVGNAVVTSLQLTPANPSVVVGLALGVQATARLSNGQDQDVTNQVSWVSSNTSTVSALASFGSWYFFRGINPGAATITATLGDKSQSIDVKSTTPGYTVPSGIRVRKIDAIEACSVFSTALPTADQLLELFQEAKLSYNANVCNVHLWPLDDVVCGGSTNLYWVSDSIYPFDLSAGNLYTGLFTTANTTCLLP
jgi:uncharacterized protein YjdB